VSVGDAVDPSTQCSTPRIRFIPPAWKASESVPASACSAGLPSLRWCPTKLATSMLDRAVGARVRATLPDEEEIAGEALSVDDHGRPRIDTGQDVTSCMS
jgi:hypothetical protein